MSVGVPILLNNPILIMILAYKGTVAYIRVPFSFLSMKIDSLRLQKDLRVFVEV